MRYDQYYRHIFKLKKIRDFFYYYRFIIFAITGTAVLSSSTIFSIKGLINGEVFFANTITYGESYQPTGTAVFEAVTYEYANLDTNQWSDKVPSRVGNYQVRGKAKNNFSDFYYGKIHYYSIVPKSIVLEFSSNVVTYGDLPDITLPLTYQDQVSEYSIIIDDYSTRETTMEVDLTTLKITDSSGEDVTFCYDITQIPSPLTLLPRPIEFSFRGGEKIYDGTPLSNNGYEVSGELVPGDRYELDPSLMQTNLGRIVNERQVRFFNLDGLDVSHLYDVTTENESLLVTKRPLRLRSNPLVKVYDGKPFDAELFNQETVLGSLLPSHRIEVTFVQTTRYLSGSDINAFSVNILNDADESVSELYEVELEFSSFLITKKPITVTTYSAQQVYNGTPLKDDRYMITSGELSPFDRIESVCDRSILSPGEISNTCEFEIIHSSGIIVTNSYDLNQVSGQLLITGRPLTIHLPRWQKIYDGIELEAKDFSFDEVQLSEDHTIRLNRWTSALNAGTYDHDVEFEILDSEGIPVTSNYQLQVLGIEDGVTIDKRALSLVTKNLTQTYNATPIPVSTAASNSDLFDIVSGDLAEGHTIEVVSSTRLINVGTVPNVIEVVIENAQGNNVTSNYNLAIETGTLTVDRFKSLTLASTNQTKIYDDQVFTSKTHYTVSPDLFPGDRISNIHITSTQIDQGSSAIVIDPNSIVIRNNKNEIITNNYDFIILANQGLLTVERRPLHVRINSQQKIYDGQPLFSNQQSQILSPTSIVPGHSLQVISGITPPVSVIDYNNGSTTPTNSLVKIYRGNVDVSENYDLGLEEGTLQINQRLISIQTNGGTKVFDGTPLSSFTPAASIRPGSNTLVAGHQLVATFDKEGYQPTNVFDRYGEFYVNSATFKIIDTFNQNRDVTFNYSVQQTTFGIVQITKRPITLSVIPLKLEYNGKLQGYNTPKSTIFPRNPLDLNPVYLTQGSLPVGFSLETGLQLQAINAGEYLNNFQLTDLAFYDSANQRVDERNFEITRNLGLVIQKRPITISSLSGSKTQDSFSFPKTKQISQGELAEGHTIFYPETPDMIVAQAEPYIHDIYQPIIYDEMGQDVTSNYQITYQYGLVIITP
jgi:hypothetical protein